MHQELTCPGLQKETGMESPHPRVTIPDSPTMEPNIVNVSSELYSELRGLITPWPVFQTSRNSSSSLHAHNVSVLQLQYLGTLRARPMLIGAASHAGCPGTGAAAQTRCVHAGSLKNCGLFGLVRRQNTGHGVINPLSSL
jgi:hypothetical protein